MKHRDEFFEWVKGTSALIKAEDERHLVTIGLEGDTVSPEYNGIQVSLQEPPLPSPTALSPNHHTDAHL